MARVLVVEDDPVTRALLTAQLRAGGHIVLASETGESATAIVGKLGCPDVIVVDVELPGMDGLTVLQLVREDFSSSSVGGVVISAAPVTELPAATSWHDGAGPDAYLRKPIIASDLLEAVDVVNHGRFHPTTQKPTEPEQ